MEVQTRVAPAELWLRGGLEEVYALLFLFLGFGFRLAMSNVGWHVTQKFVILVPDPIGFGPWPVLLDPGEPCDICQYTSFRPLLAGLFVTPRNKDDMGDGVPTDQLSHNHCDCTYSHCNSHIVLRVCIGGRSSSATPSRRRSTGRTRRVAAACRRSGSSARRAGPRKARFVISQDSHIGFVLFVGFSLIPGEQPVDGCGGAGSRTMQVRMCCSISCLVRHVSRKVFFFLHAREQVFFFSLLAFTRSYCHPRHAMACFRDFITTSSARGSVAVFTDTGVHGALDHRHHRCASGT